MQNGSSDTGYPAVHIYGHCWQYMCTAGNNLNRSKHTICPLNNLNSNVLTHRHQNWCRGSGRYRWLQVAASPQSCVPAMLPPHRYPVQYAPSHCRSSNKTTCSTCRTRGRTCRTWRCRRLPCVLCVCWHAGRCRCHHRANGATAVAHRLHGRNSHHTLGGNWKAVGEESARPLAPGMAAARAPAMAPGGSGRTSR